MRINQVPIKIGYKPPLNQDWWEAIKDQLFSATCLVCEKERDAHEEWWCCPSCKGELKVSQDPDTKWTEIECQTKNCVQEIIFKLG